MEALAEVGEAISSTLDPDEVLATIVEHAVELSGADGGSLMEYDEESRLFRVRTTYGTSADVRERLKTVRIHVDESFVGRAADLRAAGAGGRPGRDRARPAPAGAPRRRAGARSW